MNIPISKPFITNHDINGVVRTLKSGILSRGPEAEKLEGNIKRLTSKKYAVAVSSGTSALSLAIDSMGWRRGDEIITTPFSYISSGNVLIQNGIKPIFVDIDSETLNIDPGLIEKKITKKTKGLLLVDVFGLPIYSSKIKEIKRKYKLSVIEDACETIGKVSKDLPIGRIGDIVIFSFSENKVITAGEGGLIATNDKKIYEKCVSKRDQGRSSKKNWIKHVEVGYNYRLTEMQAALANTQLEKLDTILKKRERIAKLYDMYFTDYKDIILPGKSNRSWFTYWIRFENKGERKKIIEQLKKKGVTTKIYFPSIHLFPAYKALGYKKGDFPVSEKVSDTILSLPFYTNMTEKEITYVSNIIRSNM